ncbi:hypothetical protein ES703_79387 [subsurface metagenome]
MSHGKSESGLDFGGIRVFLGYILSIVIAEVLTSFVSPSYGLLLHSLILLSLLVISSLTHGKNPVSGFYLSLSLAPLIRIISLSVPLNDFPSYLWYIVVNVPVLVATVALMRVQGIGFKDAGVKFGKSWEVAWIALTGVPFGFIDYLILRPEPLVTGLSFWNLVLLALGLGLATGFVEELVFRGIMQRNAVETFGERRGLIGVALVFASLHIGWLSMLDLVFVFSIGLFYGFMVLKKGNIIGVSLSHGITNVVLFMVAPAINLI